MTRIRLDVQLPDDLSLPPTKDEKFKALKDTVSDLIEMVEVGHCEEYALKCLRVVASKLDKMSSPTEQSQSLLKTIKSFLLQEGVSL